MIKTTSKNTANLKDTNERKKQNIVKTNQLQENWLQEIPETHLTEVSF